MTDNKPASPTDISVAKSYSLYLRHIAMVSDLVVRGKGDNPSQVVQQAIEFYYKSFETQAQEA